MCELECSEFAETPAREVSASALSLRSDEKEFG